MSNKPMLKLSETEACTLRDLYYAREKVLHAKEDDVFPISTELNETEMRHMLPAFDLFRCAYAGNVEGFKWQAGLNQDSGSENHTLGERMEAAMMEATFDQIVGTMIKNYRSVMDQQMQGSYTAEDVRMLQKRIKAFLATGQRTAPRILYIADCHFYHDRICREMDHRGFSGFEEMNTYMIQQWNAKVTPKDDVYILGDFSISRAEATEKILAQLKGKLHLIVGNHDRYLQDKHFDRGLFRSIEHYAEIRDSGRQVILSHYPVFCYPGQYRRDKEGKPLTYMLYGHVHDTHDERLVHRFIRETQSVKVMSKHVTEPAPIPCNMINCFCMFSNYQPMTLNEWIEIDQKRRTKLDEELFISGSTLQMMDSAVENMEDGIVSDAIDLDDEL